MHIKLVNGTADGPLSINGAYLGKTSGGPIDFYQPGKTRRLVELTRQLSIGIAAIGTQFQLWKPNRNFTEVKLEEVFQGRSLRLSRITDNNIHLKTPE